MKLEAALFAVRDLPKSKLFYCSRLGFVLERESDDELVLAAPGNRSGPLKLAL